MREQKRNERWTRLEGARECVLKQDEDSILRCHDEPIEERALGHDPRFVRIGATKRDEGELQLERALFVNPRRRELRNPHPVGNAKVERVSEERRSDLA